MKKTVSKVVPKKKPVSRKTAFALITSYGGMHEIFEFLTAKQVMMY